LLDIKALLEDCRALLTNFRALSTYLRALLIDFRALSIDFKALLIDFRALSIGCIDRLYQNNQGRPIGLTACAYFFIFFSIFFTLGGNPQCSLCVCLCVYTVLIVWV